MDKQTRANLGCATVVALIGLPVIYIIYSNGSQPVVLFEEKGVAQLISGEMFDRKTSHLFLSRGDRGEWMVDSELLNVPFECEFNRWNVLRLEPHGKMYVVNKNGLTKWEIRLHDGEWSKEIDGEWQPVIDDDFP
jgi:hypothetical protein